MSQPPDPLKIDHITHAKNLPGIVSEGRLWSDAQRLERSVATELVGMSKIKLRRLTELAVSCHKGTTVGQYVPFYFCPRSIMVYILNKGNHPEIAYSGGQRPILHLQADVAEVVHWAKKQRVRWAFTTSNAGTRYCQFFHSPENSARSTGMQLQLQISGIRRSKMASKPSFCSMNTWRRISWR